MFGHTNEKNFECTICNKRFKQEFQLRAHTIGNHTSVREHCPICQREFKLRKYCLRHIRAVHGGEAVKKVLGAKRKRAVVDESEEEDITMDEREEELE
jgi:Zinc finger, C2H2 type